MFFVDTATTEIYTLSLHDALPISFHGPPPARFNGASWRKPSRRRRREEDRKSTRLNSSHPSTSDAVFCLKKKATDFLAPQAGVRTSAMISARPHQAIGLGTRDNLA